jgi:NADPH:quinone reductase-like Zn-dependent oxidoreductase/acyl carrier protein
LLPLSLDALTFRSPNLPQQALVYVTRITAPDIGAPSVSASGTAPAALRKLRLQLFAPDHTPITNLITLAFAHTKIQSKEETSDWMYEVSWRKAPLPPRTQHASLNWTLVLQGFTPNDPSVRRISQALQAHGQQVTMVALGEDSEALKRILAERVQRVLYLHQPMQLNGEEGAGCTQVAFRAIEGLLQLTRALIGSNLAGDFRLTVITQTSHSASQEQESVNPLEALISGIAATILAEHPSSRCKRLDVDSDAMRLRTGVIVAELLQDDREDWVSLRGNNRYVPRLQRSARPDPVAPLALTFSRGTGLSSLRYEPMQRRVLRAREIEIEVRAAALNFHDVLSAIDLLPDKDPLGAECSGVVRRTGPEVTKFSEGDEVLAIAPGCFGTYAIAEEALVCHKPASLSFEHAASLPIAYLTSDYCLHSVARLSAGQRVLVHAASGGVGLAAVHLCLRAGAELYVTAGSDRKREYLRSLGVHHVMDSRSEQFAEQIRSLTKGHGVDVVLNSLAGKLTDAGLSITANPGVFIDIGRTDVREPRQVAADYPGLAYQAVDLTQQLVNDADSMGERLRAIVDDIAREKLPALPVEEFAWDDAPNAFRHMAAARHIGKIVLSRVSLSEPALKINPGSSYIVTGGLTGLGLEAVDWLASKKAGKVVIVARRPPGEATAHRIDQLRGNGVQIVVLGGDVAETETIQRAIEESGDSLRGILHCAGAVDDAPIERQSRLSFAHTLDGKANGAWLLHQATRSLTLDFFVLHSSWATIAGSAHAANYCAANMFLDALASYRRSLGLVATSLSWGPWKNLGMSANRNDRHFMRRGFLPLTAEEGKRALEHAVLRQSRAHIALARVDWQTFAEAARREPVSLVYADLLPHALPEGTKNTALTPHKDTLLEELRSAPVHAQLALLKRRVDDVLATVLGLSSCDEVDADQPLEAMGMDSILSIEVKNALTSQFGENLPMTLLFDYPTARALTRYLAERFDLEGKQQSKDQAKSMLDELETMSDDEVEKVLTALE